MGRPDRRIGRRSLSFLQARVVGRPSRPQGLISRFVLCHLRCLEPSPSGHATPLERRPLRDRDRRDRGGTLGRPARWNPKATLARDTTIFPLTRTLVHIRTGLYARWPCHRRYGYLAAAAAHQTAHPTLDPIQRSHLPSIGNPKNGLSSAQRRRVM